MDRVITLEQVEAVRVLFVAGKHAAADRAVRRLYGQGDWVAPAGVSRAAIKERLNYFQARSQDAMRAK